MKSIRFIFATILALSLVAGYLASQAAVIQGKQADYASQVDQPRIVFLALVGFVICVVLYFLPAKDGEIDR